MPQSEARMKTLIPLIVRELEAGRNAALATVLEAKGSAPRGAGACMLLFSDGRAAGTVGGGVLEHRVQLELTSLLARTPAPDTAPPLTQACGDNVALPSAVPSLTHEYQLTQDDVQNLGMVCGGNVSLLYQALTPALLPFFRAAQARLVSGGNLWLARTLESGSVARFALTDGHANPTPFPNDAFLPLCGRKAAALTVPGDGGAPVTVFVEPVALTSHAYIFGGGHVARCVAPLLAQLDFSPAVYDDRPEFASRALFPTAADVICAPFAEAYARLTVTPDDEIVIMTRGHANDLVILTFALRTPACYIGLIGSRSKIAHTKSLLLQEGFTEADFARVHTPIGLPIQAETPMEIAVSVAAEMILCRAERAQT
jgi:xanthine dehydrogenase accessory factor